MAKEIQIRNINEFSFLEEDGARYLEGLIPYNKRSLKLPFYEYIERTAFNKTLADGFDVKALYGHDYNNVLGRVKNGSLTLINRDDGLHVRVKLPQTQLAEDTWNLVREGYITGMSFGFSEVQTDYGIEDGVETHYLKEVRLYEVSFVSEPAYPDTTAAARSIVRGINLAQLGKTLEKDTFSNEDVSSIQETIYQLQALLPKTEEPAARSENTEAVSDTSAVDEEQQFYTDLLAELKKLNNN